MTDTHQRATDALSIQLYSLRAELGEHRAQTLERLAGLGLARVEPYDILSDPAQLAHELTSAGLVAPTAHVKLLDAPLDDAMSAARTVGVETLIVPWAEPALFQDRAGVASLAERLNAATGRAADAGMRVGYHNHEFEFSARIDGTSAWEVLVDLLDERVVLQLDTYWASVGGADVFELLPRLSSRITAVHVNDEKPEADDPPTLGVPVVGRMPEVTALARDIGALVVVEVVVDGDSWPAIERNTQFFAEALS
ncbi:MULTISPECIES: sugar phosphate isomerase/epimerase family protein [Microbacterium]|uniref:Sugar phosphate isomerase/epimerase n=1 Tax=Microbacterium aurugineum TaxID=2851642 RepID=A0ABY4IWK1_9MICO|nr:MULTISPECIES: sugar phosphate isomerase/epimerase [Microbacterium]QEA27712.1 TIM barrel protein [Microbacterium sp. CBA3102]UPL16392.1 sugar phosphate isomerase/epimerase [Microbacterium aurugineum]